MDLLFLLLDLYSSYKPNNDYLDQVHQTFYDILLYRILRGKLILIWIICNDKKQFVFLSINLDWDIIRVHCVKYSFSVCKLFAIV